MNSFRMRMAAAFGLIVVLFAGLIFYAARVAPRMGRDSALALNNFYEKCRAKDYDGARALMSSRLQDSNSEAQLNAEWSQFAARNGDFSRWELANKVSITGFGGSVCVFPPFVEFRHAAFGKLGTGTLTYVRMVPEDGSWKVERFNLLRLRSTTE